METATETVRAAASRSAPCKSSIVLLCVAGLMLNILLWRSLLFSFTGVRDFTGFIVGAKLLGAPYLYDISMNLMTQHTLIGDAAPTCIFVRPPFFALAMKPLTWISYSEAFALWRLMMVGALAAFVYCFPLAPKKWTAIALCWSLPASTAVVLGNDDPLVLLFIGLSVVMWRRGWEFAAGALLGLCLAKFHFFVFLPLLLLRRSYRAVLVGFLCTTSALIAVNFSVQPNWVWLYWKALNMPQPNMNASPAQMPSFYAIFFPLGHPAFGVLLGAIIVAALLWKICPRLPFELALVVCVFGGLLTSPHADADDATLAIPALLAVATYMRRYRWPAGVLLSPVAAFLYAIWPPGIGPAIFVFASLWLLYGVLRNAVHSPTLPQILERVAIPARPDPCP